jgi:hypothetical protein
MSLTALIAPVAAIIDKLIPDKEAAAKAKYELIRLEQDGQLAELGAMVELNRQQAQTNTAEAQHRSLFVAGWRPAVGWCCALGVFWHFVGYPLALFAASTAGYDGSIPELDTSVLLELIFAMLGMGGLRTYEKLKGKAK